jgi:acyl-CoA dehydrogenase
MTTLILLLLAAITVTLVIPAIRRPILSSLIFRAFRKALPAMSETERAALEAGTVWWEAELFSGKPDWNKWTTVPTPKLTAEEQSFIDNEVVEACKLVREWDVAFKDHDMPKEAWQFIKDKGFLGMIIPKSYGGLGFSAYAHSEIVARLSTRSSPLAISVMVPNSLGPAELLLHYGTEEQKNYYLPRLAKGLEIPAFALTSPWAGSDAASIPDSGVICEGTWQGKKVIGMRVTWNKRYITLAPVCTILGLAFRLYDPDGLLGNKKDLGITCALVPHDHPGVEIGRRHIPLNTYFMNGPTQGQDVFMPLDFIIGGPQMAGQGWRMLMECLATGRAISLPSSNAGISQLAARVVSGYARIRQQFKTPISRFEGVEEALARIAGNSYLTDSVRTLSAAAIDLGQKPSVVSAIAKYQVTEKARESVNHAMDVVGGKGICMGPGNILGLVYQQMPIGITVEGANILTRSLILFGQGAIRCHPFLLKEMQAAQQTDWQKGLTEFDQAFWRHMAHIAANGLRAIGQGITGGRFASSPVGVAPEMSQYYRSLARTSAGFAFVADLCMLILGGTLKRKEKLSARLGDILSQMFLMSCVLKRYEMQGRLQEDQDVARWALEDCQDKIRIAFDGVFANFPIAPLGPVLKWLLFPSGIPGQPPSDALGHRVTQKFANAGPARDRLTQVCVINKQVDDPVGVIELALDAMLACEPIEAKIRAAEKQGRFQAEPMANVRDLPTLAARLGVITEMEFQEMQKRDVLRDHVIHVDDFPFEIRPSLSATMTDRHKQAA